MRGPHLADENESILKTKTSPFEGFPKPSSISRPDHKTRNPQSPWHSMECPVVPRARPKPREIRHKGGSLLSNKRSSANQHVTVTLPSYLHDVADTMKAAKPKDSISVPQDHTERLDEPVEAGAIHAATLETVDQPSPRRRAFIFCTQCGMRRGSAEVSS